MCIFSCEWVCLMWQEASVCLPTCFHVCLSVSLSDYFWTPPPSTDLCRIRLKCPILSTLSTPPFPLTAYYVLQAEIQSHSVLFHSITWPIFFSLPDCPFLSYPLGPHKLSSSLSCYDCHRLKEWDEIIWYEMEWNAVIWNDMRWNGMCLEQARQFFILHKRYFCDLKWS